MKKRKKKKLQMRRESDDMDEQRLSALYKRARVYASLLKWYLL